MIHSATDKAKPAERRGRKGTGPRFLREATEDSPKDPKMAETPLDAAFAGKVWAPEHKKAS